MRVSEQIADLATLLRARNPLLWIISREEGRVEKAIQTAACEVDYGDAVYYWDCVSGVTGGGEGAGEAKDGRRLRDPEQAIAAVRDSTRRSIWVFRDLPVFFSVPAVLRGVRALAYQIASVPKEQARAVIVISPSSDIPPELTERAVAIEWALPDRDEVSKILDEAVRNAARRLPPEIAENICPVPLREAAVDAALGLTAVEAESCYARSLVTKLAIDPVLVAAEKRRVVERERVLQWYAPDPRGLDAIAGLDNLKAFLVRKRAALSQRARDFGVPVPRGVLLLGAPGCGKSLTAKAVASAWGIPLLQLDLGAIRSKWVGESEANIRSAFSIADAVAPCVLWLDEIEKSVSFASAISDGGVTVDALGTILKWMQEHKSRVFVVATCNEARALPPELLRRGRFDAVFWVDLPTEEERCAVLRVALAERHRDAGAVDVEAVARVTDGFSGAEIYGAVDEALLTAFIEGERALRTEDVCLAAREIAPLSRTAGEKMAEVRKWALEGRARLASSARPGGHAEGGRDLDFELPKGSKN